ncbi:MAG: hypothetical protein ABI230_04805, partial [Aestuariivirga sp.]
MDEDSSNSGEKLNWRERLGIGKNVGGAELPKVADEFKQAAQPAPRVPAARVMPRATPQPPRAGHVPLAKPAPMAPRNTAPKPMPPRDVAQRPVPTPTVAKPAGVVNAPRPATAAPIAAAPPRPANPAPRMPPVAADALALKLKEQREAAEKLAVQRVAAAKQRTDPNPVAATPPASGKPKFAFADAEAAASKQGASAATAPPPVLKPTVYPTGQPSGQMAQPQNQAPMGYPPQGQQQQPYQPTYNPNFAPAYGQQPPAYRPIDPATGFAQNSAFQPRQPAPQPARPQVPPMGSNSAFRAANPSYQAQPMPGRQPSLGQPSMGQPRMPQMPMSQNGSTEPRLGPIAKDDVFEQAAPSQRGQRRATANDYRQAYQDELSDGYDQDRPRALGWILTAVILALLVAFGGWYYLQFNKGSKIAASGQNPPAVEAPANPAKVAAQPAAGTAPADQAGKKLIYDRIEGDHEVLGGPLQSSEQAPNLQGGAAAPPAASNNGGAVPLPLPPPPASTGQQGAISGDGKTDVAMINPAAEQSSAANSSPPPTTTPPPTPTGSASLGDLPMPTGTDAPPAATGITDTTPASAPTAPAVSE